MNPMQQNDAALICGYLLRQGYIRRSDFPQLEVDELLLKNVQDRLDQVGMELVMNTYSPLYAVKMKGSIQDTIEEESNNLNLKNNEVAMLVILWCKLILPKRVVYDPDKKDAIVTEENKTEAETGEAKPSKKGRKKKKKEEKPVFVKVGEIYAEFGKHFGSKIAFKSALTRLSKLRFIHVHNEVITEGAFMDLLIDGYQMANEIKKSALAYKLTGIVEDEEVFDFDEEEAFDEDEDFLFDMTVISEGNTNIQDSE